jgi:RNA-directed DNA polymerase
MSHWHNNTTPTGDYIELRENIKLDFNEPVFDLVFLPGNLKQAWQQVRANKGAAGADGLTIEHFPD